jgi:hypothetical protein
VLSRVEPVCEWCVFGPLLKSKRCQHVHISMGTALLRDCGDVSNWLTARVPRPAAGPEQPGFQPPGRWGPAGAIRRRVAAIAAALNFGFAVIWP